MKQALWILLLTCTAAGALAADRKSKRQTPLEAYVEQARRFVPAVRANAPSLFSDTSAHLFLFQDIKARTTNDIVTIQILESSTASNSANTSSKKSGDASGSAPSLFGLEAGASALNFAKILEGTGALNFAGQATTTRSGQLQASVSARVTEVLPNGDLVIEGAKEVTINQERQLLSIRGVVRPKDVSSGNVVLSTAIAHMEVELNGKGIVSDANRPAFLFRVLRWISPF